MHIRFWGVRGSVPTPGPKTVKYGGNTTCIELRLSDNRLFIIGAGSGIRELGNYLLANDLKNGPLKTDIFLSHTHWDHIHGYPFFTPTYFKDNEFTIHGPVNYAGKLKDIFSAQMDYTYYPVKLEDTGASVEFNELKEGTYLIGGIKVTTCYLNHPVLCIGYRIEAEGKTLVTVYDHEQYQNIFSRDGNLDSEEAIEAQSAVDMMNAKIVNHCKGADLLIHDAQYHNQQEYDAHRGWGHSTVRDAISTGLKAGVKKLALFHHDPARPDDALDKLHAQITEQLRGAGKDIDVFPAREGLTISL